MLYYMVIYENVCKWYTVCVCILHHVCVCGQVSKPILYVALMHMNEYRDEYACSACAANMAKKEKAAGEQIHERPPAHSRARRTSLEASCHLPFVLTHYLRRSTRTCSLKGLWVYT